MTAAKHRMNETNFCWLTTQNVHMYAKVIGWRWVPSTLFTEIACLAKSGAYQFD